MHVFLNVPDNIDIQIKSNKKRGDHDNMLSSSAWKVSNRHLRNGCNDALRYLIWYSYVVTFSGWNSALQMSAGWNSALHFHEFSIATVLYMRRVWLKQLKQLKRRVWLMADFDAAYKRVLAEALALSAPAATPAVIPAPASTPACTSSSTSLHQQAEAPATAPAPVVLMPTAKAHVVLPPTASTAKSSGKDRAGKDRGKVAEAKGRAGNDHLSQAGRRYHSDGKAASSSHKSRLKRSLKRLASRSGADEARGADDADEARGEEDADELIDF
jgi:hypothetical protein